MPVDILEHDGSPYAEPTPQTPTLEDKGVHSMERFHQAGDIGGTVLPGQTHVAWAEVAHIKGTQAVLGEN